jgi:hypothetical protein
MTTFVKVQMTYWIKILTTVQLTKPDDDNPCNNPDDNSDDNQDKKNPDDISDDNAGDNP